MQSLSRRQREILDFLRDNHAFFKHPPTLDELCQAIGMVSRGSLHKHINALINAGFVESYNGTKQRGVRLTAQAFSNEPELISEHSLPLLGLIAAGRPLQALENLSHIVVPEQLKSDKPCFVLQVKGDSMIEAGIFDGDWVVIEQRSYAQNGEIVVALIDNSEATLKYIEQSAHEILLLPANAKMSALSYQPDQVVIQGVLVGQMRSYRH